MDNMEKIEQEIKEKVDQVTGLKTELERRQLELKELLSRQKQLLTKEVE